MTSLPERPEPKRTRRDGNVIHIQRDFAARVRFMVLWEAKRAARQAVIRKIKAEGKAKVSLMSAGEISRLANAYMHAHVAELRAAAEASGAVQRLRAEHAARTSQSRAEIAPGAAAQA